MGERSDTRKAFNANAVESAILSVKFKPNQRSGHGAVQVAGDLAKFCATEEAFLRGEAELPAGTDEAWLIGNSRLFLIDVVNKFAPSIQEAAQALRDAEAASEEDDGSDDDHDDDGGSGGEFG